MRQKVLIFYINPNSGHHSAALAIEKAIQQKDSLTEVVVLDFMKFINPLIAQVLLRTYRSLIKRAPCTWQYLYDNPRVLEKTAKLRHLLTKINLNRIRRVIAKHKPKAIICTQAIPCGALLLQKVRHVSIPLIGVSTDYTTHSYWFHEEVTHYVVPSEREKSRLLSRGIEVGKIKTYGIPIDPKFQVEHDKNNLLERFGLNRGVFTVLIMGGSQGLGGIDRLVERIGRVPANLQVLIVAGTNKKVFKTVNGQRKNGKFSQAIRIFSHVDYIDELMEISDLIITKPGGLTTSEAITKKCPMILINPILGQESQNAEYLVAQKTALMVEDEEQLAKAVKSTIHNPGQLDEIIYQHERVKRPFAANDVASMVLDLIEVGALTRQLQQQSYVATARL